MKQLTLGELITKLEKYPPKATLRFDFGEEFPYNVTSWRGHYPHIAITYTSEGYIPSVGEFLDTLKLSVGRVFEGYKGGWFEMGENTPVWVSKWGSLNNTAVVGVTEMYSNVILKTTVLPYP